MQTFETTQGTKTVRSFSNGAGCSWASRLYVNGGEDATLVSAKHATEKGARAWAKKAVVS